MFASLKNMLRLPMNKKSIPQIDVIINGESDNYSDIDNLLHQRFPNKILKIVSFQEKGINYFKYPANFAISGKNFVQSKCARTDAKLVLDFKVIDAKREAMDAVFVCVPGKEILDSNYMEELNISLAVGRYDLIVADSDEKFFALNKLIKNEAKVIKCLNLFSKEGTGQERFLKICEICVYGGLSGVWGLYRRLNTSEKDIRKYTLSHNYLSLYGLVKRGMFLAKCTRIINKKIKPFVLSIFIKLYQLCPVSKKTIVFRTFQQSYCCNPKYICNELLKRNIPCRIVWIVNKKIGKKEDFPKGVILVQQNSLKAWYYMSCAKILVDNNVRIVMPCKKNGQYYLQTWHGSLGIKKFTNVWSKRVVKLANETTDLLLSNSQFETSVYRESVWTDSPILEIGHPRNDLLCESSQNSLIEKELRAKIFKKYGIKEGCKVVLYAPTFRDQHLYGAGKDKKDVSMYITNFSSVLNALKTRFGGDFVVFCRLHYHLVKSSGITEDSMVIDMTSYPDIQELIRIADVGITDYSSWIYDFLLLGRPGFIYASDASEYLKQRELYFPIECTPFPFAPTMNILVSQILDFEFDSFLQKRKVFLDRAKCIERGNASEKAVDRIVTVLTEK